MNLTEVMSELGDQLDTISKLNVYRYSANKPSAPAALVSLPDDLNYLGAYGRGLDSMTLPVTVLVGKMSDSSSHRDMAAYANGSGARSVKQVLEAGTYTAMDTVVVESVDFLIYTVNDIDYLAAEFAVKITGSGS
jgi:hypothetical protein